MRENGLRWYEHVQRKKNDEIFKKINVKWRKVGEEESKKKASRRIRGEIRKCGVNGQIVMDRDMRRAKIILADTTCVESKQR